MNEISRQSLLAYNEEMKRVDEVYRNAVKHCGLAECAFWILYTLRVEKIPYTQSALCELLHEPKQTVNSALKKLEADGDIFLTADQTQRGKLVCLTPKGQQLAAERIDPVAEAEARALRDMTPEDRAAFIRLTRLYGTLLAQHLQLDI